MRSLFPLLMILALTGCGFASDELELPPPTSTVMPGQPATIPTVLDTPSPTTELHEPPILRSLPDPASAQWIEVLSGFTRPIALAHSGDDRLFVAEQAGLIWAVEEYERLPEPFLDIRDRVGSAANEQGLLGLAFHPDYPSNGYFYINYTDRAGGTVVSRFRVADAASNQVDPGSETILLTFSQPYRNHNGGGVAFGPDGYLYIGTGDGGSAGDPNGYAQNLNTLLGKILRIDVNSGEPYVIPPGNPFSAGDALPEIWAYGLRNPWRFSFDVLTEDLYIADVGQNSWEEVNFQPANSSGGENYGWAIREGSHPFGGNQTEGLIDPIAEYDHAQGCSVTGGHAVRDPRLPGWDGVYLFGDYCSGLIWGLLIDDEGVVQSMPIHDSGAAISSFGLDSMNRVYLVDHGGSIFRLDPVP